MGLFRKDKPTIKAEPEVKASQQSNDVIERDNIAGGIFKAYIPKFLYKPPYGYPRPENIPLLKVFGKYPYIFGVINLLQEEAAGNPWKIVPKDGSVRIEDNPELMAKRDQICDFLNNPNGNNESFGDLTKACIRDICEVDAGCFVKVFNRAGKMVQLFARDGGAFLKNPDIYGYMGDREDIILPASHFDISGMTETQQVQHYDLHYRNQAAYFQYSWTSAAMPIPFGKREIVYFMKNPRTDSMYGISPVQVLADIILTLVYGSQYNLDFYMNSNIPEGVLQLIGAQSAQVKSVKERLENSNRFKDSVTGFFRKVGFKMPVVNVEAKFTPFQLPAKELQIIEQQEWFTKVVWMCFGISPEDMGFTQDSNKAVSQTVAKRFARKAVRPLLRLMEERINMEIIPEFGTNDLKFKFEDYDLDEDIQKHSLYEAQLRLGIKTPEMIAEEEGIDLAKLKKSKEEKQKEDEALFGNQDKGENFKDKEGQKDKDNKDKNDVGIKANPADEFETTELETELVNQIKSNATKVVDALKLYDEGKLDNVK